MVGLPKLLEELFGKHVKLALEILSRANHDGFDVSEGNRKKFYKEFNTSEYLFYRIKAQMESIGLVHKEEGKLVLNRYFDIDFSRDWRRWLERQCLIHLIWK